MKIAQIAPLYESVPPRLYGGTERVVAHLCDALVEMGHDVHLFAAADACTRARLVPVREQAIRLDPRPLKSDVAAYLIMLDEVRKRAAQFDILHFHVDLLHLPLFEAIAGKCVTTVHGRLDLTDLPAAYSRWSSFGLVSISADQRKPLQEANWLATIHHGLPPQHYPFTPAGHGEYLAFIGRMSPEKRPDLAVKLALRAGIPLRIAGKVDASDRLFFETVMQPLLKDPLIEFIGEIGDAHKAQFLGNAAALLFPIDWPEPFGLVMIESMACGTPVIAWNCGSVSEIVDDGVTGFIVESDEQALSAIARASLLERKRVRGVFERRFSANGMARSYLQVYARLLESQAPASARESGGTA